MADPSHLVMDDVMHTVSLRPNESLARKVRRLNYVSRLPFLSWIRQSVMWIRTKRHDFDRQRGNESYFSKTGRVLEDGTIPSWEVGIICVADQRCKARQQ